MMIMMMMMTIMIMIVMVIAFMMVMMNMMMMNDNLDVDLIDGWFMMCFSHLHHVIIMISIIYLKCPVPGAGHRVPRSSEGM